MHKHARTGQKQPEVRVARPATWTPSLGDIANIAPQRKNQRPGNAWHPKHSADGLVQSAAMPALAARQERERKKKKGANILSPSLTHV